MDNIRVKQELSVSQHTRSAHEYKGSFSPGFTVKTEKEQSASVEVSLTQGHFKALYKETTRSTELFNSNRALNLVW